MAAKKPRRLGTIASILFTSLVCPLFVQVVVHVVEGDNPPRPAPPTTTWCSLYASPAEEDRVVALGAGVTPEAAWDDAVRSGLRAAVIGEMAGLGRLQDSGTTLGMALGDARGLITHCLDLECTGAPGLWRRKVAVYLDRAALASRVRAAQVQAQQLSR